jgi:hypothetical protein
MLIKMMKNKVQQFKKNQDKESAMELWEIAGDLGSQIEQLEKVTDELAKFSPNAKLKSPLKLEPKQKKMKMNQFAEIFNYIIGDEEIDLEVAKQTFKKYREAARRAAEEGKPPKRIKPADLAAEWGIEVARAKDFLKTLLSHATPTESIIRALLVEPVPIETNREFSEAMSHYDDEMSEQCLVATRAITGLVEMVQSCRQQLRATA